MLFQGETLTLNEFEPTFFEICFDNKNESVNKFNQKTLDELKKAVDVLKSQPNKKGLLLSSAKDVFFVGADILEFVPHFETNETSISAWITNTQTIFSDIEDLGCPSIALINGFALGGGLEVALTCQFRIASPKAKIGLPETKLGIIPGWGGTVRLPRLIGADNAIEWITTGANYSADAALKFGAIDAIVVPEKMRDAGIALLKDAASGKMDWKNRREEKMKPLTLNKVESGMTFATSKAGVYAVAGKNYPAPLIAVETIEAASRMGRDEAMKLEAQAFGKVGKTPQAKALISIFVADQLMKKNAKKRAKSGKPVKTAAVLGAGIMGGGIAYQSASTGTPIIMKDIGEAALELGLNEAGKLLEKQVSRGKLSTIDMAKTLGRIRATLTYGDLKTVDIVVEAVTENEKVKTAVLKEMEENANSTAILTSNTSTISITKLGESLKDPSRFCGMHFFNPVHRMPLVEVIRGKKSSEEAIATTVAYATAMGKTAVVVNDCPGFLVNRVLFPYLNGFLLLLNDGVEFTRIDKVMEKWGWPMGPAYLSDVVGIDTAHHAHTILAEAFPDRMKLKAKTALDVMYAEKRFGQKNGKGFYSYKPDAKGAPKKEVDPATAQLLAPLVSAKKEVSDDEIVFRVMLPLILEASRCLEEKIVETATEVDISLLYGLGFPPFRGGALVYADTVGAKKLVEEAKKLEAVFGAIYQPTEQLKKQAADGKGFYV